MAVALLVVLVAVVIVWSISVMVTDASIVDLFWGLGFALVCWVVLWLTPDRGPRSWLVAMLVTIWGLRLSGYLAIRNLGHGEDYRYQAMRARYGRWFPLVSLPIVFLTQGLLIWIVSLPIQVAVMRSSSPLSWIDLVGTTVVLAGLSIETVADWQLARFKRSPANRGRVMDAGLWRYSRHPNYFGDAVVWWGFGLFALGVGAPWAVVGSVVMTVLLLKVSGVALLESTIVERRPAYRDYMARTSAFVPWPPKGGQG